MTAMLKPFRIVVVIVLVLVFGGLAWWWTQPAAAPKWTTARIDQGTVISRVTANGTLTPVVLVNVGTQISGTVLRLHTDFNQTVKAGQLLAELDPSLLEAQIRQTQASLASARANQKTAESILSRNESLMRRGFVSEGALDQLRKDVDTTRAQVLQIEAQLARDQTNLSYSKIRSPIEGTVVSRGIDVGQTVAASFQTPTLFQIAQDLRRMQIDTSVAEADVGTIKPQQAALFTVDAFRDQQFPGAVRMVRLNPVTQQNVVTYNVVIDVDNKEGQLLPGMTAQVSIVTSQKEDVLRVPSAALRFRPPEGMEAVASNGQSAGTGARARPRVSAGAARVYVPGPNQSLIVREIKTGITDGRFTEVLEGLALGDEVVIRAASATDAASSTSGFRFRMF